MSKKYGDNILVDRSDLVLQSTVKKLDTIKNFVDKYDFIELDKKDAYLNG